MRKLIVITALSITMIISACENGSADLKVNKWGPQSTTAGDVPNKQPDGGMGIWVEVSGSKGLGKATLLFDGQPAKITDVSEKLITAEISPEQVTKPGNKEIVIMQTSTGKLFPVGIFAVQPAK